MESQDSTMLNVQSYITILLKDLCLNQFKDFLPPTYTPSVQKNSFGDSEFTTPCSTQIFNMCSKKPNWPYKEIQEVADVIAKNFVDEKKIISNVKITAQAPTKKPEKKKDDNKKDETKKKKK